MSEKPIDIDLDNDKVQAEQAVISNCLNCGQALVQDYCSNCGQSRHIHRSFAALWHDFSHGVMHFDGKFWHTLPALIFKPGVLTREYIAGKRAQYISPMALFLFSIFLMFAVFSFISSPTLPNSESPNAQQAGVLNEIQQAGETELLSQIDKVQANIAEGQIVDDDGINNQEKLASLENALKIARDIGDQEQIVQVEGLEMLLGGDVELAQRLQKGIKDINENSDFLLYKMKANGYKFSWLLIPVSIPFVWIAMLGVRGHHFYDHAIFTIYSMSFITILFIILAIMGSIGFLSGWLIPVGVMIPIIHLYKQIRHAYQLSRLQTVLRLIILCIGIVFSLLIFFAILLLLGILG